MNWWEYFKGRLAYDAFLLAVSIVLIAAVFVFLLVVEMASKRKRRAP